jgi:hypothetical protein
MLKSILFGPSSLNSKKQPSRVTQGKVWGTKFVTPGAIAFMAILVSQRSYESFCCSILL